MARTRAVATKAVRVAAMAPRLVLIGAIRLYQLIISPMLGPRCKYYPSCSAYGLEAVKVHGAGRGSLLAAWRVLRCNPWSHGGVDDVPPAGAPLFSRRPHTHASDVTSHASVPTT